MSRIAVYGWLYVVAPIHGGMAVTLLHPALDRSEYFPLAVVAALIWFAAVAFGMKDDSKERSWRWAGKRILAGYILPLLVLAAVQVGLLAYEGGEFRRLWQDCHPAKKHVHAGLPKNTPPESPWPSLRRLTGILAAWIWASVWFLTVLCNATPTWLWLSALVWGLVRFEK
jgi:hypothetical protein